MTYPDDANPPMPATARMVAEMRPLDEAPKEGLLALMFPAADGTGWRYVLGLWREDVGGWCADAMTMRTTVLPPGVSHWCASWG